MAYPPLIRALCEPSRYPHRVDHVDVVETHISWVLLTGEYAYKIKKPLSLGFLDFSTLERREYFCREELRLNQRTAPELYLDVVAVTGTVSDPCVGGDGRVVEYAVRMREFEQARQLDRRNQCGLLTIAEMSEFGRCMAGFYDSAAVDREGRFGNSEQIGAFALDNLTSLARTTRESTERLRHWTRESLSRLEAEFSRRQAAGWTRECHGDLHLSNLVKLDGGITAFDCIEFEPALRWIDPISDIAFLVMDFDLRKRSDLGSAFLNGCLEENGDYQGVRLLRFYLVYRSLVRSKVAALRLAQPNLSGEEAASASDKLRRHLELAQNYIAPRKPRMILMHGLAASGKTWLSGQLMSLLPGVRIRSDVERKRRGDPSPGLYSLETSRAIYTRLAELAEAILDGGCDVIVDAAFLRREDRRRFLQLAHDRQVDVNVVSCRAADDTVSKRLCRRGLEGEDASDADAEVLAWQRRTAEPLDTEDAAVAVEVRTDEALDLRGLLERLRALGLATPSSSS